MILRTLLVAATLLLGLLLARRLLVSRLDALARRTTNRWDDLLVLLVRRTWTATLLLLPLWTLARGLELPEAVVQGLRVVTVATLALQLATWANLLVVQLLEARVSELRGDDPASATTLAGVALVVRGAVGLVIVLLALDNLGVNISALVAGLGIGGVAIALATQNILGDLFASLSIVLDKPFVVGDFIVVGDLMGTVERVGLKTTRLRSLSGEQLVFSNADLLGSRVRNYKRMAERRVVFTIGVTYGTTEAALERMPGMLREIVTGEDEVRFDRAHLRSFDDSAITFEVVYYVLSPDYNRFMDIQQSINFQLVRRLRAAGVDFAFPTRTVYLEGGAVAARNADAA